MLREIGQEVEDIEHMKVLLEVLGVCLVEQKPTFERLLANLLKRDQSPGDALGEAFLRRLVENANAAVDAEAEVLPGQEVSGKIFIQEFGFRQVADQLEAAGISGIGNIVAAAKMARYVELDEDDVVLTVLTDSMDLYGSRLAELREAYGELSDADAERIAYRHIEGLRPDALIETTYRDRRRIHNLKYYTWVEQQGMQSDELTRQWYDKRYWQAIQQQAETIDAMIAEFNAEVAAGG